MKNLEDVGGIRPLDDGELEAVAGGAVQRDGKAITLHFAVMRGLMNGIEQRISFEVGSFSDVELVKRKLAYFGENLDPNWMVLSCHNQELPNGRRLVDLNVGDGEHIIAVVK